MALDRQSIEKKDFPVGRRGYEPEAVDAHLNQIAEEVEELKRASGGTGESLSTSAGERVRAIVEVAETTAAQLRKEAEADARRIRADARKELETARERAGQQATEQISKITESGESMLARIESLDQEIKSVMGTLREGAGRLSSELRVLDGSLSALKATIASPAEEPAPEPEDEEDVVVAAVVVEEEPEAEAPVAVEEPPPAAAAGGREDDLEGARLIALNMALNGNSREDIDRYLQENFDLSNRDALLDEVYASVEG